MLGGIDNALFLQSLGGFFALAILILFLKWAFPTKNESAVVKRHKDVEESPHESPRK